MTDKGQFQRLVDRPGARIVFAERGHGVSDTDSRGMGRGLTYGHCGGRGRFGRSSAAWFEVELAKP